MKCRIAVVLVIFGATAVAADDKADPAAAELKKLQGTWTFESHESAAGKVSADGFKTVTLAFEGDKYTVKDGDTVITAGTLKLDPAKKAIDAKVTEGPSKGTTMLGIYEFDGDTLKVCFDPHGRMRPTEFKSTAGSGHMLVVVKREKK